MSKKFLIIITAAGLVSFAGVFVFAWLTPPSRVNLPGESELPALAGDRSEPGLPQTRTSAVGTVAAASGPMTKAMTEQQLRNLVQDVRGKMLEYNNKLQELGVRERRLQLAQDMLKDDIENLDNLRIELTSIVASLKSEQDRLLKSRLEIAQAEKTNLVSIAATYDKMEVSGAGKILINMCTSQIKGDKVRGDGSSFDDAVKILYYMTERTKAKLLAELATSEPTLAAALCQRLKQIVEAQ